MKICITGGSGFVGSRLIAEIQTVFKVVNIDKRQSPFFPELTLIGDIRDPEKVRSVIAGADLVVHLAAEHKDNIDPVDLYYDTNVNGTRIVLEAMEELGINRMIFTSTVAVYGLNKTNPDETTTPDPFNHYGKSKWQAEQIIEKWQRSGENRSAIVLRPTVIFGERNRGNVYNLINQIALGRFLNIGNGENKKSMAYVGNIVAFIQFFITYDLQGFQVFNYVDKPDLTVNELVSIIVTKLNKKIPSFKIPYPLGMAAGYGFDFLGKILGRQLQVSSIRVKKFCATTQFDCRKASSAGFIPPFTLKSALERTLEFEFISDKKDYILFETE